MVGQIRLDLLVRIPIPRVEGVRTAVGPAGLREVDVGVDQARKDPRSRDVGHDGARRGAAVLAGALDAPVAHDDRRARRPGAAPVPSTSVAPTRPTAEREPRARPLEDQRGEHGAIQRIEREGLHHRARFVGRAAKRAAQSPLDALDSDRSPARVQPQRVAAFAEAARQASARDLALDAQRQVGLDRVAGGLDREVRVRVEPRPRCLRPRSRACRRASSPS